jgi:hypothetical protein
MSSFQCEICGTNIVDSENGYVTECEHYKIEHQDVKMELLEHIKKLERKIHNQRVALCQNRQIMEERGLAHKHYIKPQWFKKCIEQGQIIKTMKNDLRKIVYILEEIIESKRIILLSIKNREGVSFSNIRMTTNAEYSTLIAVIKALKGDYSNLDYL